MAAKILLEVTIGEACFANQEYNIGAVYFQNNLFEERILRLEEDFRSKFRSISALIDDLEISLKRTIDELQPEELARRVDILEEYKRISEYKEELESIDEDSQACEEASRWLDRNRKQLIGYVVENIFDDKYSLKRFKEVQVSAEAAKLFCQDIDSYFRWLGHYLRMGITPEDMPRGVISLALPSQIYMEAFKLVRNDKVSMNCGLSGRAITMLTSYINKFLIKRDLDLDAL
ncbi:MAG: hypothetical protein AAF827_00065 [Cyanobacteria bacterium P01_D01_bin.6]